MSNRVSFYWYTGAGLSRLLPYRKKGLFSKALVCEWAAVHYMTTSGFMVGCSLALASENIAEEILKDASSPVAWRIALDEIISNIQSRVLLMPNGISTFQMLFPETVTITNPNTLMSPEECGTAIGQRVILGLVFGILYPELASKILNSYVTQNNEEQNIGFGGLRIEQSNLLTSFEQAKEMAMNMYQGWLRS